jgi:pyruvate-formate lyase-activating enzyme
MASVHANGEVVCSIIDGRGDFTLGNVHHQSLGAIFHGPRARELRRLVLSTRDAYCSAIGKRCPLKSVRSEPSEIVDPQIRFLGIEPTTACGLRCLTCLVRDFAQGVTWRDALADGGGTFLLWDAVRRSKQHLADRVRRSVPALRDKTPAALGRPGALLLRGRVPRSRRGSLPLEVLKRVVSDAGPAVERVDLFGYGEPFLYRPLVEALRYIRSALPNAGIVVSTNGMWIPGPVEDAIVNERLLDWLIFSIDGGDDESYRRYRIGGVFEVAFANLARLHARAAGTPLRVIWQYVVFSWNDSDRQLERAMAIAQASGIPICFDFAHTWGRSRRRPDELRHLAPYLKPFTALPGEPRRGGW